MDMTSQIHADGQTADSDALELLRDSVRRYLGDTPRLPAKLWAQRADRHWPAICELGLPGMLIPESFGGSGGGLEELAVVQEAWGHGFVRLPLVSTAVVGAWLLAQLGTPSQQQRWLPAMASGKCRVALAELEPCAGCDPEAVALRAQQVPGGFLLNGRKRHVIDGDVADLFLVSARLEGATEGLSLFCVEAGAAGLRQIALPTLDGAAVAMLEFESVALQADGLLGQPGASASWLDAARDRGLVALCWEAVGAMQALLMQTAAYLQQRQQFGQSLASFQALRHQVADMALDITAARAAARMAQQALATATGRIPGAQRDVGAAKVFVGEAGRRVAERAVQLHGGMGMTDELAVGHHFKRLHAIDLTWGDAAFHLQRYAGTMLSK